MMNNIEKKLDALIDALGFDVKVIDSSFTVVKVGELDTTPYPGKIHRTDYKLTKRDLFVPLPVNSDAWGCMVEYLSNHTADIEFKINDFDTLAPMLDFINRNSNEKI